MKWRRQAKPRTHEAIHTRVYRLMVEAQHDQEREYLCWLSNMAISGSLHQQYILEMAKKPDALDGLSEEDIHMARRLYAAECEGLDCPFDKMEPLQEKGFIRDLERLPGRGRYAGRYAYYSTDRLAIVAHADVLRRANQKGNRNE